MMKKIVLYSSNQIQKIPLTGGVRRFLELAANLGNYCDLTVMTGDDHLELPDNARHVSTHQKKEASNELELAFHNRNYLKQLKRKGYDWIIAFDVPPAIWLVLFRMPHLCLMVRKDLIGYQKIVFEEENLGFIKRSVMITAYSIAELLTLLHAEKIIVQCNYDKNELLKRHKLFSGLLKKKMAVQINNVNPSWAQASKLPQETQTDCFKVGSVNGFSDLRKGCDMFLEAVATILDEGKIPLQAWIAGDGRLLSKYKEKYKAYKSIQFSGRITNPGDYIRQFDLAVVPSRADSCPNTVMEALLNGVPVIASSVGGIPEILEDKTALFDPNAASLMNKLIEFTDTKKLEDLTKAQHSRNKALQFDWSKKIFQIICGGLSDEQQTDS